MKRHLLFVATTAMLGTWASAQVPQYTIQDVGPLITGQTGLLATGRAIRALDDRGRVLHSRGILNGTTFEPFTPPPGFSEFNATDMNNSGRIVGNVDEIGTGIDRAAILEPNGTYTILPYYGIPGYPHNAIEYIGDGGTMVARMLRTEGGSLRYALGPDGQVLDIRPEVDTRPAANGFLAGHAYGLGYGIWHPDGRFFPQTEGIYAHSSRLVVTNGRGLGNEIRIRNYNGTLIAGFTSPYSDTYYAINDREEIAWVPPDGASNNPYVTLNYWSPLTGKVNLYDHILNCPAGLLFTEIVAINERGQILVRGGTTVSSALLLTPVPEPATVAALGLGLVLLKRRKRTT